MYSGILFLARRQRRATTSERVRVENQRVRIDGHAQNVGGKTCRAADLGRGLAEESSQLPCYRASHLGKFSTNSGSDRLDWRTKPEPGTGQWPCAGSTNLFASPSLRLVREEAQTMEHTLLRASALVQQVPIFHLRLPVVLTLTEAM